MGDFLSGRCPRGRECFESQIAVEGSKKREERKNEVEEAILRGEKSRQHPDKGRRRHARLNFPLRDWPQFISTNEPIKLSRKNRERVRGDKKSLAASVCIMLRSLDRHPMRRKKESNCNVGQIVKFPFIVVEAALVSSSSPSGADRICCRRRSPQQRVYALPSIYSSSVTSSSDRSFGTSSSR